MLFWDLSLWDFEFLHYVTPISSMYLHFSLNRRFLWPRACWLQIHLSLLSAGFWLGPANGGQWAIIAGNQERRKQGISPLLCLERLHFFLDSGSHLHYRVTLGLGF